MTIPADPADVYSLVDGLIGDQASEWDAQASIPMDILRRLGAYGLLCPQAPAAAGGLAFNSLQTGQTTAHVGSRCSSVRSVMTSHGMAAWSIQKLANKNQRELYLPELTSGKLAAVSLTEPDAGSDLSKMTTRISRYGNMVSVDGHKVWVTGAAYADVVVVFARIDEGAAAVLVPMSSPGVELEVITDALGCRAAGHANIHFKDVRLPEDNILGREPQSLPLIITTALSYGRLSVAWGCVGILRACLGQVALHARTRRQFGKPLQEHQLIKRYLAELFVFEQSAAQLCERASRSWDAGTPDMTINALLAKQVSARNAAQGSAMAVQVLASAGARVSHPVARAYRDSKLMEIIEGSTEICQLLLADHAMSLY